MTVVYKVIGKKSGGQKESDFVDMSDVLHGAVSATIIYISNIASAMSHRVVECQIGTILCKS